MERNIYKIEKELFVTSDEEITRNDYWLNIDNNTISNGEMFELANDAPSCKKIILTTDQDLIKDDVQAIDDEFLEWFVNNPSCEFVVVKQKQHFEADKSKRINPLNGVYYSYKIIIPKEEPKQETLEEAKKYAELSYYGDEVDAFIAGAKWQAERMYSEEEVLELIDNFSGSVRQAKEWFEQFKK